MTFRLTIILLAACAVLLAGCTTQSSVPQDELLVFAAASLTDAMTEVAAAFEADAGTKVAVSYGASQALAQQIASGAPADLYIAAGKPPMDFLQAGGHIPQGEPVHLLTNKIVMATDQQTPPLRDIQDLIRADIQRITMPDPQVSPAGSYTKTSLQNLDLWDDVQSRLVFAADVRTALGYVQAGNADAAFVYQTDVAVTPDLVALDIVPTDSYPKVIYPATLVGMADGSSDDAQALLDFLQGDAASQIFRKYGFTPLN